MAGATPVAAMAAVAANTPRSEKSAQRILAA
jgi:hypothetical protein